MYYSEFPAPFLSHTVSPFRAIVQPSLSCCLSAKLARWVSNSNTPVDKKRLVLLLQYDVAPNISLVVVKRS